MSYDIVGVGLATVDCFSVVSNYKMDDDTALKNGEFDKIQCGGPASTAIVAASRLGAKTSFIGNLGEDNYGQMILSSLVKYGVDTSAINLEKGRNSHIIYVTVERETGERYFTEKTADTSDPIFSEKRRGIIKRSKFLHLDATDIDTALKAAKIAQENNVTVSLDGCVVSEKIEELLKLTDLLITNESYPGEITGMKDYNLSLPKLAEMGPKIVISTLGSKGSIVYDNGQVKRYGVYNIKPVDTTGAGDVFHGAFLYACLQDWPMDYRVKFSSAVSAINCLSLGGREGIPETEVVMDFIENNKLI